MSGTRSTRNQPFCWQEKKILRLLRKYFTGAELQKFRNLYLTITEIDSDFNGKDIKFYTKTVSTYSGLSKDWIPKGLKVLEELKMIQIIEDRENGKFKGKRLIFTPENIEEIPLKTVTGKPVNGKSTNGNLETSEDITYLEDNLDKEDNKKIDRYPKGTIDNKEDIEKQVTSNEVINQSLDTDKVKFRENLKKYMNMVSNVTNKTIMEISNVINPQSMKEYDLSMLIEEIENSDFLSGKLERKPMITNFTRKTMIDRILIGEYRNKVEKKEVKKISFVGMV